MVVDMQDTSAAEGEACPCLTTCLLNKADRSCDHSSMSLDQ